MFGVFSEFRSKSVSGGFRVIRRLQSCGDLNSNIEQFVILVGSVGTRYHMVRIDRDLALISKIRKRPPSISKRCSDYTAKIWQKDVRDWNAKCWS